MTPEVIAEISKYGYWAIFLLIFLQETGVPNPIPNELVLLFCGYLSFTGALAFPLIILTAVSADFIGTNLLYVTFYFSGNHILSHLPRWIPVSQSKIDKLERRIAKGGKQMIYFGRLTPFIRGYTSVACGLIHLKPKIFLPIALLSGITWSLFYVIIGRLLGPFWNIVSEKTDWIKGGLILIAICALLAISIWYFIKKEKIKY